jgi:hypothetical protein
MELSKVIYTVTSKRSLKNPKLCHQALDSQMGKILHRSQLSTEEPFSPPDDMDAQNHTGPVACRTFIVAKKSGSEKSTRIRSYRCPSDDGPRMTVHQAANATMAHPGIWPPITVNDTEYDGSDVPSNPSLEAIAEASQIWPNRPICLVSLGTGLSYKILPDFKSQPENHASFVFQMHLQSPLQLPWLPSNRRLAEQCVRDLADCEGIHWTAVKIMKQFKGFYFRLNVPQRMSKSDLQEWTEVNRMEVLTEDYLNNADQVGDMTRLLVRTKDFERKKRDIIMTAAEEKKNDESGGNFLVGRKEMAIKSRGNLLGGTAVREKSDYPTVSLPSHACY